MDVGGDDAGDEEEAVDEGVGVGACEEEDGEGWEEDVDYYAEFRSQQCSLKEGEELQN